MRAKYSNLSLLPFYRDRKNKHEYQCGTGCSTPIQVPTSKGVPNFQLVFEEITFSVGAIFIRDACDHSSQGFITPTVSTQDIDGKTYTYWTFSGNTSLAEGQYYLDIPIIQALPYSIYSENFQVCGSSSDYDYKLTWKNDCNGANGQFDSYENELYIKEIDYNQSKTEETYEEKVDGNGDTIRQFVSSKIIHDFNIYGNDYFYESLSMLKTFDTIELTNQTSNESTEVSDIDVSASSSECEYLINIQYSDSKILNDSCCDIDSPFRDPCDTDTGGGTTDCSGYSVIINHNTAADTLSYSVVGSSGTDTANWFINGASQGGGSIISLGAYGTYAVQATDGQCTATDQFIYSDPCDNIDLQANVNGATIAGSATGDDNIVITVLDSLGVEIATGLPYTVTASQSDGTYIVKAKGDHCERQLALYVQVTPPQICEHTLSLNYDEASKTLTGATTGCSVAVSSESIEKEDSNGNITVVATTGSYVVTETGIYYYKAICDGCLKQVHKLVVVDNECMKVELCNENLEVIVKGIVKTVDCTEDYDPGDDTNIDC